MKRDMFLKYREIFLVPLIFGLSLLYLFPMLQGLILLPLDLLIARYAPWYAPATILLKNPYMQDSIAQLFPWRHLVFTSLTRGVLPLWNPYQFLGMPFLATLKPMVFYPLNLLFLFGEKTAWNTTLLLQITLAMLFAYALAREFRVGVLPSLLSGFAFGLSSLMIAFLEFASDGHTIIWWPLLILFAKRFLDRKGSHYLFLLSLTIAVSVFAGHLQYLSYMILTLGGFILVYGKNTRARLVDYLGLAASTGLGFGLAGVQLIPAIELFSQSHRGLLTAGQNRELFTTNALQIWQHARLFAPDFFGNPVSGDLAIGYNETSGYFGIIPLFFAMFAMVTLRKDKTVRLFRWMFLLAFLVSLKSVASVLALARIPVLMSGSAERLFAPALFSGAILSAFGFAEYLRPGNERKKILSLGLFTALCIAIVSLGIFVHFGNGTLPGFVRNIRFPAMIFGAFALAMTAYLLWFRKISRAGLVIGVAVLSLTFFDLFRLGYRFLTFSNEKFLYPELGVTAFIRQAAATTLGRTFGLTEPELATHLAIQTVETYNPLYPERTARLLQALQRKTGEPLSVDNKYFLSVKGAELKRALDVLGVAYLVVEKDDNPSLKLFLTGEFQKNFTSLYRDDRHAVYRNADAHPRFDLFFQTRTAPTDDAALTLVTADHSVDLRRTLVLTEDVALPNPNGSGSAALVSADLNRLSFQVETNAPAMFYLSDTFFPGWKAWVNGSQVRILRANYNFRAVAVPEGRSTVAFRYEPESLRTGGLVSLGSLIAVAGLSLWLRRRE